MIASVRAWTASVIASGAGPPFATLYLMPKSPCGPPGLCEADRISPPKARRTRMTLEAAGVDSRPPWPTSTRPTPFAAAMRRMVPIASRLKYRPSPPTTSVWPARFSSASKIDCTKFST